MDDVFLSAGAHTPKVADLRAIPFAAFQRSDPIFRLSIDRALWVYWERVGQPNTRPVRRRWRSGQGTS